MWTELWDNLYYFEKFGYLKSYLDIWNFHNTKI